MNAPGMMLVALAIEALLGWPDMLDRRIGHPVRWFGWLVARLDRFANRPAFPRGVRMAAGGIVTALLVGFAAACGMVVTAALSDIPAGTALAAIAAASLVAARSLHDHVAAVGTSLAQGGIDAARLAVGRIVGRRTEDLDEAGVLRAAIESLAENTSDGVTAPLFWGALFGLPGLFAYKAVNTLDSMIGHRSARYEAFGKVAARLDDVANLVPARLTGALFALCAGSGRAGSGRAARIMWRDAPAHRSPNAGWPEAAMAGALGLRLSGPRRYGERVSEDRWLNPEGRDAGPVDLTRALALYRRSVAVMALALAAGAWWLA